MEYGKLSPTTQNIHFLCGSGTLPRTVLPLINFKLSHTYRKRGMGTVCAACVLEEGATARYHGREREKKEEGRRRAVLKKSGPWAVECTFLIEGVSLKRISKA